jgi:DMSO/TMAO reductase YedYZ molybdopterin-dependent catalytic subunit
MPINRANWTLNVTGEVHRPLELTFDDLDPGGRFEQLEQVAPLDCTGGWYSTQRWQGVRVIDLCDVAGIKEGQRSLTFVGITGYSRGMPISDAANLLLATHVGDEPLSYRHGAPLRLVTPNRR